MCIRHSREPNTSGQQKYRSYGSPSGTDVGCFVGDIN